MLALLVFPVAGDTLSAPRGTQSTEAVGYVIPYLTGHKAGHSAAVNKLTPGCQNMNRGDKRTLRVKDNKHDCFFYYLMI